MNGRDVRLKSVPDRFLTKRELEVEVILNRTLHRLSPLWSNVHPSILDTFGDVCPVGPMKERSAVMEVVAWDHTGRHRAPYEIYDALKVEGVQNATIWDLVWVLARVRGNPALWELYSGVVAFGSPVSDGFTRKFPYLNGSPGCPCLKLVHESYIGDPNMNYRYLGRPIEAEPLRFVRSVTAKVPVQ